MGGINKCSSQVFLEQFVFKNTHETFNRIKVPGPLLLVGVQFENMVMYVFSVFTPKILHPDVRVLLWA